MNTTANIVLDVNNSNTATHVYAKQGDSVTREIIITLTDDGKRIFPETGSTAIFRARKPDNTTIFNTATINEDGTITATLTDQVLAAEGQVAADVYITDSTGATVLSTGTFYIDVEKLPFSGEYGSYNEFKVFEGIIEELKENNGETFMTELVAGKQNKVLYGSSEPASSLGEAGDIYIKTGTSHDYIVSESIPTAGGSLGYRKWNSGYMEVFGYTSLSNIAITNAWNNNAYYSAEQIIKLPTACQMSLVFQGQISCENGEVWVVPKTIGRTQENIYLASAKSQTLSSLYIHIYLTGRWTS